MSTLTVTAKDATSHAADAVVVLVARSGAERSSSLSVLGDAGPLVDLVNQVASPLQITGDDGSLVRIASAGTAKAPLIVVVGVGEAGSVSPERVRRAVGSAVLGLTGKSTAVVVSPDGVDLATAAAEGALLGAYSYCEYKGDKVKDCAPVGSIVLSTSLAKDKNLKAGVAHAHVVAESVHGARDLVNMPPLDLYPAAFADRAVALAAEAGVTVTVLDDKQLQKQGYGGLTGVGQGSSRGPRLVRLEWNPAGNSGRRPRRAAAAAAPALALVGKGITFDSGGISIKPAANMEAMKSDMAGAATVLHTVLAVARLKLPIRVTGWLCIAENMPSGTAQRPSDVITIYGGRTVEVLNTDAEGRLVLADGIVAASEESPGMIVDVATLTGAQTVALGNRVSAIMSNNDALRDRIFDVSKQVGEQFWPMPLPEELRASLDSQVADIANMGDRFGGMLVAGLFLKEFVGPVGDDTDHATQIPWAHLDIAGPALNTTAPHGYTPKGGTGVAVRTLLGLAEQLAGG